MKRMIILGMTAILAVGVGYSVVSAGGDKTQNERGAATAPGPGDDAQGNQVGGD